MRFLSRLALMGYSAALTVAQPLLRRKLRRRARVETGYGEAVEERFGFYAPAGWSRPAEAEVAASTRARRRSLRRNNGCATVRAAE